MRGFDAHGTSATSKDAAHLVGWLVLEHAVDVDALDVAALECFAATCSAAGLDAATRGADARALLTAYYEAHPPHAGLLRLVEDALFEQLRAGDEADARALRLLGVGTSLRPVVSARRPRASMPLCPSRVAASLVPSSEPGRGVEVAANRLRHEDGHEA